MSNSAPVELTPEFANREEKRRWDGSPIRSCTHPRDLDLRTIGVVIEKNGEIQALGASAAVLTHLANAIIIASRAYGRAATTSRRASGTWAARPSASPDRRISDVPVIPVNLMQGRTNEQKKLHAQRITPCVVEVLDAKPEAVRVLMHEMGPYDFAVGGVPMAERSTAPKA